jgi:hypothetical protein
MKKGDYWFRERKQHNELKMSDTSEEYSEQELPIESTDASVSQEQSKKERKDRLERMEQENQERIILQRMEEQKRYREELNNKSTKI